MRVTKQINERTYEVMLEDKDISTKPYIRESKICVQHDYIGFIGKDYIQVAPDSELLNPVGHIAGIHIPIRAFQQVVLPILQKSPYMLDKHFDVDKDGKMKYDCRDEAISSWEDGQEVIYLKLKGDKIFSRISRPIYELIKKGLQNDNQNK